MPLTVTELEQKVIAIVAEESGKSVEDLSMSTNLLKLGLDSLEFVVLLQALADQIATIPDSDIGKLNTIGDIVRELQANGA